MKRNSMMGGIYIPTTPNFGFMEKKVSKKALSESQAKTCVSSYLLAHTFHEANNGL
jgi:hypothetical protein